MAGRGKRAWSKPVQRQVVLRNDNKLTAWEGELLPSLAGMLLPSLAGMRLGRSLAPENLFRLRFFGRKHRGINRCATVITDRGSVCKGFLLAAAAERGTSWSEAGDESRAGVL
jgi:hypothetical protein